MARKPTIGELIGKIKKQAEDLKKSAFVPMGPGAMPPMDPAMMGGGAPPLPPMDPAMMGGAPPMGPPPGAPPIPPELMGMGAGPLPPPPGGEEGAESPEDSIRKIVREELDEAGVKRKKVDQEEVLLAILKLLRAIATALNIPVPEEVGIDTAEPEKKKEERESTEPQKLASFDPAAKSRSLRKQADHAAKVLDSIRRKLRNAKVG